MNAFVGIYLICIVHYHIQNSVSPTPYYFSCKNHFPIILPPKPLWLTSGFSSYFQVMVSISHPFHSWHTSRLSRPSWFNHSNYVWWSSCLYRSLTPVTSSHFDRDINLRYLFTKTLNPYSLIKRKQVCTLYKTTSRFVSLRQCFPNIFLVGTTKIIFLMPRNPCLWEQRNKEAIGGAQQLL